MFGKMVMQLLSESDASDELRLDIRLYRFLR